MASWPRNGAPGTKCALWSEHSSYRSPVLISRATRPRDHTVTGQARTPTPSQHPRTTRALLRHGSDFGVYGVWGGMVEGERRLLRRRWLGGTRVTAFLQGAPLT